MWWWWKGTEVYHQEESYLRVASPNERRCIARESLGFYSALLVGGIYEFLEPVEVASVVTYTHALRQCVHRHPQLSSAVVVVTGNDAPYYQFCPRLDLREHIQILELRDEQGGVESIDNDLQSILDAGWPPSIPAWKIVVRPLSQRRCFVGFAFSHALGDGVSGLAFHGTFLGALQENSSMEGEEELICTPKFRQLDPPFDTPGTLPISWSYLLSPLLGAYLPKVIASLLGLRAAATSVTPGTWTGSSIFYRPGSHRTGVKILSIDARTVDRTLRICRMHGGKLTGLLHQFIVTALAESLPPRPDKPDNFAARTALNMRGVVGRSNDEMGNFASGDFQIHPVERNPTGSNTVQEVDWMSVKAITDRLASRANELRDQPIGLLRYLNDVRSWILSQLGDRRDCSYEVSNLGGFQPPSGRTTQCSLREMLFCQPADVTGAPLTFNVVSVAPDGPLTIAVSWQVGALDLNPDNDETVFVETVCQTIAHSFTRLAQNMKESWGTG